MSCFKVDKNGNTRSIFGSDVIAENDYIPANNKLVKEKKEKKLLSFSQFIKERKKKKKQEWFGE